MPRGDDTGETGARRNDDSERCSVRGVAGMFADVSLNLCGDQPVRKVVQTKLRRQHDVRA